MRRQKPACPGLRIAGAEEARGRIMRWLSVLPWPPTGLADGFGRGLALPPAERGSTGGTHPNAGDGSPARPALGGNDSAASGAASSGEDDTTGRTQTP